MYRLYILYVYTFLPIPAYKNIDIKILILNFFEIDLVTEVTYIVHLDVISTENPIM